VAEAAVAERQRLERDLHDGAQQRLVWLGTTLARTRTALPDEPARASALLDEAISSLEETAAELRNLARGIHPGSLTRYGLSAALADMARRSPLEPPVGPGFGVWPTGSPCWTAPCRWIARSGSARQFEPEFRCPADG
jgi:signal transduction histidine kinase